MERNLKQIISRIIDLFTWFASCLSPHGHLTKAYLHNDGLVLGPLLPSGVRLLGVGGASLCKGPCRFMSQALVLGNEFPRLSSD